MSWLARCDFCGMTDEGDDGTWPLHWVRIERRMHPINEPSELHFCSWSCVAAFAITRDDQPDEDGAE